MTSTTDATLDVVRGTLILVTVSEDYREWPRTAPEDRTFYATASDFDPDTYVTMIVPETDDRHRGMWATTPERFGLQLDGQHYGWNVPRNMVRPYAATPADTTAPERRPFAVGDKVRVDAPHAPRWAGEGVITDDRGGDIFTVQMETGEHAGGAGGFLSDSLTLLSDRPRPASADMTSDQRVALSVEDAYPVGSQWQHFHPTGATVTVLGYRHDGRYLHVTTGSDNSNDEWIRGALDFYGTFVGWADDAPAPAVETTPETFTREDVDHMVEEAREAAKREADAALEAFKREANRIAVQYAEDNGLCSQFERAMDDIGLLGREEWHDANDDTYRVTFTVSLEVTGRDEDDAEDKARSDLFESLEYPVDRTIQHHSTEVL